MLGCVCDSHWLNLRAPFFNHEPIKRLYRLGEFSALITTSLSPGYSLFSALPKRTPPALPRHVRRNDVRWNWSIAIARARSLHRTVDRSKELPIGYLFYGIGKNWRWTTSTTVYIDCYLTTRSAPSIFHLGQLSAIVVFLDRRSVNF